MLATIQYSQNNSRFSFQCKGNSELHLSDLPKKVRRIVDDKLVNVIFPVIRDAFGAKSLLEDVGAPPVHRLCVYDSVQSNARKLYSVTRRCSEINRKQDTTKLQYLAEHHPPPHKDIFHSYCIIKQHPLRDVTIDSSLAGRMKIRNEQWAISATWNILLRLL
jgi:hypothetical protein